MVRPDVPSLSDEDQPRRARAWFEAAIGEHLDLGRPERVSLVVNRTVLSGAKNKTPGRFATEVITRDVAPQLQIHYKSSKAKAYLKEGRALRVETTVNNADDFALRKLSSQATSDFYDLLIERHTRSSSILTSNRGVEEWMSVFDEPLLGQSALDRFCHRAHQFVIDGESYRKRTAPSSATPLKTTRKATT